MDKLLLFVKKENLCLSYIKKSVLFDVSNSNIHTDQLITTAEELKRARQQEKAKLGAGEEAENHVCSQNGGETAPRRGKKNSLFW